MIHKICTGEFGDECYCVKWKAPNGNPQMNGVTDNERNEFYHFTVNNVSEFLRFLRMLNMKEKIRHHTYDSIEEIIKKSEDRYLEQYEKFLDVLNEKKELEDKYDKLKTD